MNLPLQSSCYFLFLPNFKQSIANFPLSPVANWQKKTGSPAPTTDGIQIDVRVALLKNVSMDAEQSFRDYKKFRADSKIVGIAEAPQEQ